MKRSDFLRKIARAYERCDGNGDRLIENLVGLECIGTARGVIKELQLAANDLDRLTQLENQIRHPQEIKD